MSIIVKQFNINTGDRIYSPGDTIVGIDEQHEKQLVDDGYCEYVTGPVVLSEEVVTPPSTTELMTVEDFSILKAPDQISIIEKLGIDPGSNKDQRVQQYQEWISQQESGVEGSNDEEFGPNTGMTV